MSIQHPVDQEAQDGRHHPESIRAMVSYLPAAHPFRSSYAPNTIAETVRTEAMAFFGVRDRQERDTYHYFLELGGVRITDTNETLELLAAGHHHEDELHFNLVEEITPGSK
jgi:hypothetical protein